MSMVAGCHETGVTDSPAVVECGHDYCSTWKTEPSQLRGFTFLGHI